MLLLSRVKQNIFIFHQIPSNKISRLGINCFNVTNQRNSFDFHFSIHRELGRLHTSSSWEIFRENYKFENTN